MSELQASVVIPTFRRPARFARALDSVLKQTGFLPGSFEIVVVDNSAEAELSTILPSLAGVAQSPWPIRYIHEPRPGVAQARNTGVQAAASTFIAFLDDDEIAHESWLLQLLAVQKATGAEVVFGRIQGKLEDGATAHPKLVEDFFSRDAGLSSGPIKTYFGTGNSLISRHAFALTGEGFDLARSHTGGEDDVFFSHLEQAGGRFAWSAHALVWEMIPRERATRAYMRMRGFMIGQGPPVIALNRRPPDYWGLVGWMAVGLAQLFIYAFCSGFFRLSANRYRADYYENRMMQGLGKFLWMDRFRPRMYGMAAAILPHVESVGVL